MAALEHLRPAFTDDRFFNRFRQLAFGMLTTDDRRTVTAMLEASGQTACDWSSSYRVFSRDVWEPAELFAFLMPAIVALHPAPTQRVIAALDDTTVRKTGTHIPGVAYRRDPMSPPFRANFIRAQRFVQTSVAIPFCQGAGAARAIPVGFDPAPSAGKLPKNASKEQRQLHRQEQQQRALSTYGIAAIKRLRKTLDDADAKDQRLLMTVDGSYTNQKVIKALPERTDLIGRIRKDAVLHRLPDPRARVGRPACYGQELTPELVRQDDNIPWQTVSIFGAGRVHECSIKEVSPVLWRKTGQQRQLRLIIIRPLAYRRSKQSRLLYRQPAYLICTDLDSPVEQLVQAYFWRWDIEVNHRDEKQLMGLGDAQVRSPKSAERAPAFAVICYALLLISAATAFGLDASEPVVDQPKWRVRPSSKPLRLSTRQLLRRLQLERIDKPPVLPNFDDFASHVARSTKRPKGSLSPQRALTIALS